MPTRERPAPDAGAAMSSEPAIRWESLAGETYACIDGVDGMAPFLMTVVSNGDAWLFPGSNGGLTAGRRSPDEAVFPYRTADQLLRQPQAAGVACIVRVGSRVWEPWRPTHPVVGRRRRLFKHEYGTSVVFEEDDLSSGLRVRWRLCPSEAYGLVRECSLENRGRGAIDVEWLDGWHLALPPGVTEQTYARYSYLAAAYMRHELLADSGLAVLTLNAAISDRPEPAESLRAAVAWSVGHRDPVRLLSDRHLDEFRAGRLRPGAAEVRGEFGAYLVRDRLTLEPGAVHEWLVGIDTGLDHAAVVALDEQLRSPREFAGGVRRHLREDARGIRRRVAAADGLQRSADRGATVHHFSNTLFNVMRGGTFESGYRCPAGDVTAFLGMRNRGVLGRHAGWARDRDGGDATALAASAAERGDAHLERLISEYLPICFSRRHGDPSRPWNRFDIRTRTPDGGPAFAYSGNWRDLFQNWEALGHSHPGYLAGMIAVFLNASTADGYNPYRISREGVDWEVPDPADPWSHIGYWGDHQIVYLLRLLQAHERFWPGELAARLDVRRYGAVVVPYRIKAFEDLVRDPRHSIEFDRPLHDRLVARAREIGSDGLLLAAADGEPRLFSLAEKLLVPALAKISNLVPDGGIWLNTQRPEWNDANNALAGWGLSVVTACHLRAYLGFLEGLFSARADEVLGFSAPVAALITEISGILPEPGRWDATRSRDVFSALGKAGAAHRAAVYAGLPGGTVTVAVAAVRDLLARCLAVVDGTIRANRRADGMYVSYNVLDLGEDAATIRPLGLMLEGQVAVLSSGLLDDTEAVVLLDALAASPLYRADQASYMLQADRPSVAFLERNRLPTDWRGRVPRLAALVASGDASLVIVDRNGTARFHADIANAAALRRRFESTPAADPSELTAVLGLWEEVFAHGEFTGRSGSFFAFEGLGSIYWHMVAKLLLAVQEQHDRAAATARPRLAAAYRRIRDGLGFRKSPAEYGAFPHDAYSHTPRHAGAQQPGMTGQVKEETLTRLGELGVRVGGGAVRFRPELLPAEELLAAGGRFEYLDVAGRERVIEMPPRSLGFTFCQVPVICHVGAASPAITVRRGSAAETIPGDTLSASIAAEIFLRRGSVTAIEVAIPGGVA